MAEGADHLLQFEAAAYAGFFPSLAGADGDRAIACGGHLHARRRVRGERQLEETEARLADTSQYVTEKG